jgi:hypothetical protein
MLLKRDIESETIFCIDFILTSVKVKKNKRIKSKCYAHADSANIFQKYMHSDIDRYNEELAQFNIFEDMGTADRGAIKQMAKNNLINGIH